jgi:phosphate transport system protein
MQRAIQSFKRNILTLGGHVEEIVDLAVNAVEKRDETAAQKVLRKDDAIDQMEVDVEEEGLKLLALYQPVAVDLRFIVATMKINNDLERIGDIAVNIAERAIYLAGRQPMQTYFPFAKMAAGAQTMLKQSLDALVNMDPQLARTVCESDDTVDDLNRSIYEKVCQGIRDDPQQVEAFIQVLGVSRHLERIADLATNISEEVIYMATGDVVRHRDAARQERKPDVW